MPARGEVYKWKVRIKSKIYSYGKRFGPRPELFGPEAEFFEFSGTTKPELPPDQYIKARSTRLGIIYYVRVDRSEVTKAEQQKQQSDDSRNKGSLKDFDLNE
jgi:hypothetical protein